MNTATAWAAIAVGAVAVLGAVAAAIRMIWKVAQALRDNTQVTNATRGGLTALTAKVDKGFDELGERLRRLEGRRRL